MAKLDGLSQLSSAQSELTKCWSAKDPASPDTVKQAYHALILLSAGLALALEDIYDRLPKS